MILWRGHDSVNDPVFFCPLSQHEKAACFQATFREIDFMNMKSSYRFECGILTG